MNRILLADGDAAIRETLGGMLATEGYAVVVADTAADAAAKIGAWRPELVLLDLNLPDPDGAFMDLIYHAQRLVPVITITAISGQYERAAALGVDALMEKPLDLPLLLQSIRSYLDESQKERMRRLKRTGFKTAWLRQAAGEIGHLPRP
jgi:DNA-binding response OmpR family regulator